MKARLVSENIEFTRGGSSQDKMDRLLGPRRGSIYVDTTTYPRSVWVLVHSNGKENGLGSFRKIGIIYSKKKYSDFRWITPKEDPPPEKIFPIDNVVPVTRPQWEIIKSNNVDYGKGNYLDRFEKVFGINIIRPIFESMISESIEFTKGGTDQQIKDKILGRIPKGTLYFTSGKFPYLYMLFGNATVDSNEADFLNIGHFSGGGGKKTQFSFVANRDIYSWNPRFLKKDFPPRYWDRIKDAVWTDNDGKNSWDRIEEETGIKPILPVNESMRFERGASDADIKRELRADGPFQPGEIVIRDLPNDSHTKKLHVYIDHIPKNYLAPHSAYSFGTINRYNNEVSFIHNTSNKTGRAGLQDNNYLRRANREEAKAIRKALQSGRYDRYIEEAKKKTGLTPFV